MIENEEPVKTSIATVSLSGDLREKLSAIAAAGFDGVEIFENDFLAFDGTPREVGGMVRDHGLAITLFQPFRDFEGLPEPQRSRAFDRAERKFDLMQELGTDLMLVCSNVSPLALGGIDRAAADFRELGERAAQRGLRVGYEALAWGRHVSDHRDAWEVVRRADHSSIGLILDSFHTLARRHRRGQRFARFPATASSSFSSPTRRASTWTCSTGAGTSATCPAKAICPFSTSCAPSAATGYDGPLSLEIFNDQFRGGSPKSIAVDGRRSLIYLMDRVRRAEPALVIDVPAMPDRIAVSGVEFVEFAASDEEAEALTGLLSTMGFSLAARHKHRDVSVWRQGEGRGINLVINTGHEGFAHSSYVVHGTTAYAIGLRVADAAATVARARALGAEHSPNAGRQANCRSRLSAASAAASSTSSTRPLPTSGTSSSTASMCPPIRTRACRRSTTRHRR